MKYLPFILALLGAIAVISGAFGAHGLKPKLTDYQLEIWNKGVLYHFIHCLLAITAFAIFKQEAKWVMLFSGIGIVLFSGSLYLLSLKDLLQLNQFSKVLGPITPIGGLFFILSWVCLAFLFFPKK